MSLRNELVKLALKWEKQFGVAPNITGIVGEYDVAMQVGLDEEEYSYCMRGTTAVQRGHDFIYNDKKYQVKACRPSGKPGSKITKGPDVRNYDWDYLVWVRYNKNYQVQEMWRFGRNKFELLFADKKRLTPDDMRMGKCLFSIENKSLTNKRGKNVN